MAAMKSSFTLEEVLEEVLTESDSKSSEEEISTLSEVIRNSVKEFYSLRSTVDFFIKFQDEATKSLEAVYRRNQVGLLDESDKTLDKPLSIRPVIAAEIMLWLKSIYRRMTGSPRAQNPWYIELRRGMPKDIFLVMIEASSKSPSGFGISVESTLLKFTHIKRLIRDFSKLSGASASNVKGMLQKIFKGRRDGCKAEILVSYDKPFIITYDEKHLKVVVKCYYGFWNELGYGFHC